MCMSSPRPQKAPDPVVIPPEPLKKLELNPAAKKSQMNSKKLGTRKLQIPMGGTNTTGGSGLGIPK